jgi:hypothetical protein
MPKIPTYDQNTVRAAPMPQPQLAMQTPDMGAVKGAFDQGGAAMAASGERIAHTSERLFALADKVAEEDSKTSAQQAYTLYQADQRKMLFHDDTAFYRQTGETAYKAYETLQPAMEERRKAYGEGLSDHARRLYDAHSMNDQSSNLNAAARHASTEREKWRDGVTLALADSEITNAANAWADPTMRDASIQAARNAVLNRGQEKHLPYDDVTVQAQLREIDSKVWTAIITRAATDAPEKAKALFDANKDRLDPRTYHTVAAQVEAKFQRYAVQTEVARIEATVTARPPTAKPAANLSEAIHTQESGGKAGDYQIQPGTWAQYAKAGEDPANPAHQKTVYDRILADLSQASGGDAARIAVGYFSGKGNIAPQGSPTPWKEDRADKNGKSVSSYVADISARLGDGVTAPPGPPPPPGMADQYQAQRAEAEKITDLKTRDLVMTQLDHKFGQNIRIDAQKDREAKDSAWKVINGGGSHQDVPADVWARVDGQSQKTMLDYVSRRSAGADMPFNATVENMLHEMQKDQPEEFKKMDLTGLWSEHAHQRVTYWQGLQRAMESSDAKAQQREEAKRPTLAAGEKVIKDLFPFTGKDKAASENSPGDAGNAFERHTKANMMVRQYVEGVFADTGKVPDQKDLYRYAYSLAVVGDKWFSSPRRIEKLGSVDEGNFPLDTGAKHLPGISTATGIDQATLPLVIGKVKARGLPVTYENIQTVYNAGIAR